jgi:hypothetical protein
MAYAIDIRDSVNREGKMYARRSLKVSVSLFCVLAALCALDSCTPSAKDAGPTLKIVKDALYERNDMYFVKGTVYNPNVRAVKDVEIRYYIWKKWRGKDGYGSLIKSTGGLVEATFRYIPPKGSVEFEATGDNAPVMTVESGLLPDPLAPEITADWDK